MEADEKRLGRVKGFEFSAVSCGIKKTGDLDLALIYSKQPASVAGVFTTNRLPAAPVRLDRARLASGRARAVLANSGCANACTGSRGYEDAVQSARWVAEALGIPEEEVLVASTGVIGGYLPMEQIRTGIPHLIDGLHAGGLPEVARGVMTTDTRPKWTARSVVVGESPVSIAAVAKGAGMIHPQMATLLCFVVTDASVSPPVIQEILEGALDRSFHAITVDGDTSTNDTVLILANGGSETPPLVKGSEDAQAFEAAVGEVLEELAIALVRDAEGATKLIHLIVEGAPDRASARSVARAIAHSPLVKTAFHGEEVNWGRILAAVGYSGVRVDPHKMALWYEDVQLVRSGEGVGQAAEEEAQQIARRGEFAVRVSLGMGEGRTLIRTCDLSQDYIAINASYKT